MTNIVRSPRQASNIFGLDGNNIPRKKSMFYVRFRRTDNNQASVSGGWQDNFSFVLKSIDRPAEIPEVQEMNQYNKKKHVITGIKYEPMNMVLYDVADNVVFKMWDEYTRYYYGDYNQEDERQFDYDQTLPTMYDNGAGFGYVPRRADNYFASSDQEVLDLNSYQFFDAIEVYQVFGGNYIQFDLINPKITNFNPDELDYEQTSLSTISITVVYEAILRKNGGKPMPIADNEFVAEVFRNEFYGDTFETEGPIRNDRNSSLNTVITGKNPSAYIADVLYRTSYDPESTVSVLGQQRPSTINNSNYDFGVIGEDTSINNNTLNSTINGNGKTISASLYDATVASISSAAKSGNGKNFLTKVVAGGIMGSGMMESANPIAKTFVTNLQYGADVQSAVTNTVRTTTTAKKSLSIGSSALAVINSASSKHFRIGKKIG